MTQIALHWWPKSSSRGTTTATGSSSSSSNSNCCGLSRLMTRLKKQRSKMLQQQSSRRQSSSTLQCRYDPLSYSLNFDTTASGDFVDDDYYKYYAFSSRFVAAPTNHCQRILPLTASH